MDGWITKRHQQTGVNLRKSPEQQRKGPLRKIVGLVKAGDGLFDRDLVELECGHRVRSDGIYRARCDKCLSVTETDKEDLQ